MASRPALGRRAFLARIGVLGAAAAVGGALPRVAHAAADPPSTVVSVLRPALDQLSRDTLNGLGAFVLPGNDEYSKAQGTPRPGPGAQEARTGDFLISALDNFVPFPDELARPLTTALGEGLSGTGVQLPEVLPIGARAVDNALKDVLNNDAAVPLSLPIAALLNLAATRVDPAAVNGPFLAPFPRLSYADKARAFELIENADADLVDLLDAHFPEPVRESVSGLLAFVGGALLEFASFGSHGEWAVFDPATKQLRGRPVGWQLSGYEPHGPVEGWDEFLGYYQNRTEVHD
jgi:hypothetical protein